MICRGATLWLLQRISAIFMLAYFFPMLAIWLTCPNLGYIWWSGYLSSDLMLALLLINLLMFFLHAIIGIWTVLTDYVPNLLLRNLLLLGCAGYTAACLGWAVFVIIL
jgi:succinate dehydrogenase / fumarate reductase membrane anchor subunit